MITVQQLKEEKRGLIAKADALNKKVKDEKRKMTNEEDDLWNSYLDEVENINGQIDTLEEERFNKIERVLNMEVKTKNKPADYRWVDVKTGNPVKVYAPGQRMSNPSAEEKDLDLGRALRALAIGNFNSAEKELRLMTTAGSASVTIPQVLSNQLIDLVREKSIVLRCGVRTVEMPHGNLTFAKASNSFSAQYKAEGSSFTYQDLTFGSLELKAKTMGVVAKISRELAQDSVNASQVILDKLSQAIADELDRAFIKGAGTAADPYIGLINLAGSQTIAAVGALSNYNPFVSAYIKALKVNATPNAYIINPAVLGKLATLATADGIYITAPSLLSELPQLVTNHLPDNGGVGTNESTAIMGDFTKAFWGVTQGLQIETSTTAAETFAGHDVAFKVTWRGDLAFEHENNFIELNGITTA